MEKEHGAGNNERCVLLLADKRIGSYDAAVNIHFFCGMDCLTIKGIADLKF